MSREQKYHGKVRAMLDSLRDASVKLMWGKLIVAKCQAILPYVSFEYEISFIFFVF
jgi:hypothetical protein